MPLLLLLLLTCGAVHASTPPLDYALVKSGLEDVAATLAPLYLPVSVSPSSPCGQALQAMAASLASNASWWAANMVDSWGKTLDGTAMGINHYYGNYDQCVHTAADDVTGKYCTITTSLLASMRKSRVPEARKWRPGETWHRELLARHPGIAASGVPTSEVSFGTCMPSVCTRQELQESLAMVLLPQGVLPTVTSCSVLNSPVEFTTADIGFTAFLVFLAALVVCASLVDMFLAHTGNQRLSKGVLRYLLVFSAYTNLGKILQVNPSPAPGTITCLHAMRVFAMTWVIYGHQVLVQLEYVTNLVSYPKALAGLAGQLILNGYSSVDTFFFLSGLLVSNSVLRGVKKSGGRFNVPLYFLHRLLRLVPSMGIVVGLYATVLRFLMKGPVATGYLGQYENCKRGWWTDILFVSNFLREIRTCLGHTWYLGVDMQLYLVAPIIILPLYWYAKGPGEAWLFLLTVFSTVIPASLTYAYDWPPTAFHKPDIEDETVKRYMAPWCRASPWLAGVWLRYFLYRQGNARLKMSPVAVVAGWSLASVTGVLVVFGMYSYSQLLDPVPYDVMTQLVYSGLHSLAWGAAVAWVVLACHNGYEGVVNDFLSHPVWQPFSRLTYTTYLVAKPVQLLIVYNARSPFYFTYLNTVMNVVGVVFLSVIVAACVVLVAESPVLGLERLLLRSGGGADTNAQKKAAKDTVGTSALPAPAPASVETHKARPGDGVVMTVEQDVRGGDGPRGKQALDVKETATTTAF